MENYFNDYDGSGATRIASCTKSFISALVGIAPEKNDLHNLDQKISEFFPEYFTSGLDARKVDITILYQFERVFGESVQEVEAAWLAELDAMVLEN